MVKKQANTRAQTVRSGCARRRPRRGDGDDVFNVLIVCYGTNFNYSTRVRLNWKLLWLTMPALTLPLLLSGCGGVNAGTTVSPASFLLPGLLRNDTTPATNAPGVFPTNDPVLASAK